MNHLVKLHCVLVTAFVLLGASAALGQQAVLISVNNTATNGGNGNSVQPSISADGRFIAFESQASDLTTVSDTNGISDVFVRDQQTGITTLVSVAATGTTSGNGVSGNAFISANGRFVVFESAATNLVTLSDTNNTTDIFVRDLQTGVTTLVSVNNTGTGSGNGLSQLPVISANGRTVVFQSNASNLAAISDTNNQTDVFARDLQLGTTTLVSVNVTGANSGTGRSSLTSLRNVSDDGRFIVYQSEAGDLVTNDSNGSGVFNTDVFVRDLQTATTFLVTINSTGTGSGSQGSLNSGAQINANGRFVAFESRANNLVAGITEGNSGEDIFVRDLVAGTTTLASINAAGTGTGNNPAHTPSISGDGRFVAFASDANNLVPNDNNNGIGSGRIDDVFVRDLQLGTTTLVSINSAGTDSGNSSSDLPQISTNGRFVLFQSGATNLTSDGDFNSNPDIFVRDLQLSTTTLISRSRFGGASGILPGNIFVISGDGLSVAFSSRDNDLTINDQNGLVDIFSVHLNIPTVSISGQVKDNQGNPLQGVTMTLSGSQSATTTTNASGVYLFNNLTNGGSFTVTPSKANYTFSPASLTFNNLIQNATGANFVGTLAAPSLQLNQSAYSVQEGAGSLALLVNRAGDPSIPVTVNYATADAAAFLQNCNVVNGKATSRCDYVQIVGTLHFASGETSKTLFIPIVDDAYTEGTESFSITLSNPTGGAALGTNRTASIQITDNGNDGAGRPNPIDGTDFFVRQHYIDFLGREPDPAAIGWVNQINNCVPSQPSCDRLSVSQGIFNSPEFKDRGYFIYKFYSVAFGRKPSYDEFVLDQARVSGFKTDAELEQAKLDFIADFMSRAEFAPYNSLTNDQYVQTLFNVAGVTQVTVNGVVLNVAAMQQLLNGGSKTRAQVLRDIVESPEVSARFLVESTIVMHYFGYLRRDPDAAYQDWINILNQTGDARNVTNGFVNSPEYRMRFGQ